MIFEWDGARLYKGTTIEKWMTAGELTGSSGRKVPRCVLWTCLLDTSDAADDRLCVALRGRRCRIWIIFGPLCTSWRYVLCVKDSPMPKAFYSQDTSPKALHHPC
mgnify:CR=1 FL=1